MVDTILPGIYRLEIPLPEIPLKSLNAYIIKGEERNLIIDTGLNRMECLNAFRAGVAELSLDLAKTDFFITHAHSDHCGLIPFLKQPSSIVYASQEDAEKINGHIPTDSYWQNLIDYATKNGFPPDEAIKAMKLHPGRKYAPDGIIDFKYVNEGTILTIGNYQFTCIATPGHSPGHMCLYEPYKRILLSGDHILGDITPNISLWSDQGNPLETFLQSLAKIAPYSVDLVLPGHRRVFTNCRARVQELMQHHHQRASEILTALSDGTMTGYQIAATLSWRLTYKNFEDFPSPQKWYATGETIAHLRHLESQGRVYRVNQGNTILYALTDKQ